MTSWHSYPKVWSIGHAGIASLFDQEVYVQEKIDGSQFSFGIFNGELKIRSKGQEMILDAPEKMFAKAVETVISLKDRLVDGWTYRGEYLSKPKHNVLAYDRVPKGNIILFDVNKEEEGYLHPETVQLAAKSLGLECVPILFSGKVTSAEELTKLLDTTSCLGGQKIEGFVVKNYIPQYGRDKKAMMGKFVSEAFKEKHKKDWKVENPGSKDIIALLVNEYRTPARWDKAIIHLREAGLLEDSPKDIGKIIKEVPKDLLSECEQEIRDALFAWAFPSLVRGINRGLAEYYKSRLLKSAFEETKEGEEVA